MAYCIQCVSQEKNTTQHYHKRAECLSYYWIFKRGEALEKFRKHENSDSHLEEASMSFIG